MDDKVIARVCIFPLYVFLISHECFKTIYVLFFGKITSHKEHEDIIDSWFNIYLLVGAFDFSEHSLNPKSFFRQKLLAELYNR